MHVKIITRAKDLGFLSIGFTKPVRPLFFKEFTQWVSEGKHADMAWLGRHIGIREDPSLLLPGCRTIISLAYPYPSERPTTPDGFTVSRYSQPALEDYHVRLKRLCRELTDLIKGLCSGCKTRVCVDSAPVMERSLACSAGIGFIGKNNMLIIPGRGSYLFLAEILTTASIGYPSTGPMMNQCRACTRCIDSCPTGALEAPFSLDAEKCLSYLTIEHKGTLKTPIGRKMGRCFFGCDRCQEVCPFNADRPRNRVSLPTTDVLLQMDRASFKHAFGKTTFSRAGLEKLKANIRAMRC